MLNFFKNLFGSGETETHSNGNGYATAAPPPAPVQVQARPVPPIPQSAAQRPAPVSHSRPVSNGQGVQIPLYTIIAILPLELKTRIRETMVADVFVSFPLDRVLTQLGAGAVKITFGELRALVPNVFSAQSNLDSTEILLPLNEILPQINPELIARRHSQRQVQIPEDVSGPFGNGLSGVTLADPRSNVRPSAPRTPTPIPPSDEAPIFTREPKLPPAPAPAMRPVTPVRPSAPIPFTPPAPAPAPAAAAPIPFRSSIASTPTPRPPTAVPSVSPPVRPVLPAARGVGAAPLPAVTPRLPSNGNGRPPVPVPVPVPQAQQAALAMPAAPAAPVTPEVYLNVPLAVLTESWPEVLRSEIEQLHLSEAHLALPMRIIEPALKQGKISFPWKVLRSWIRPATLPTVSAHDGMMLELPLRVIAPLFLARLKQGGQVQQKVKVNDNIPNLFFGFPQGDSAAAAIEAPAAPVPTPPRAFAPEPEVEEPETNFTPAPKQGVTDTNFYVWGETDELPEIDQSAVKRTTPGTDFLTRYATPNEVVARASALEGVVGALVALPDGLMVASKLSADLNGDTLAAFLPHIFGKVSQCTKELRMGELNNLHFTVGNVPWKIFRVNAIFFAAFGNAGQPLPTAQLAALAAQLDRKK